MKVLFQELRRRKVFRVATLYAVTAWMIAQASVVLEGALNLPDWFDTIIVVTLLLGLPIALIVAWAFELTPDGFKPTGKVDTPPAAKNSKKRRLDIALGAALAAAVAFIAFDTLILDRRPPNATETAQARNASIAVLPFADMSSAQDQVYFGDGIAEELLNLLAKVDGLRVASRTSAFTFRERTSSIDEIAEALNVSHVLEGSIRKSGDQIRITAQLIETGNDEHLWSETYDRALTAENLFTIQDEIAQAIINEVGGQLQFNTRDELPTTSTAAYELFLSGRAKVERRGSDDILDGIKDLEAAMRFDPNFFDAALYLAKAHRLAGHYADTDFLDAFARADDWYERAEALNPGDPRLVLARARLRSGRPEFDQTVLLPEFEKALSINPNDSEAYRYIGLIYGNLGRTEDALSYTEQALALDPKSSITLVNAGIYSNQLGQFDKALSYYRQLLELEPDSTFAHKNLSGIFAMRGDARMAHRILMSQPDEFDLERPRFDMYLRLGLFDEAAKINPEWTEGMRAIIAGDIKTVRDLLAAKGAKGGFMTFELLDILGLKTEIQNVFDQVPDVRVALLSNDPLSFNSDKMAGLAYEHVFSELDPDGVAHVRAKVDAAYSAVAEKEFTFPEAYIRLAKWHARRGRADDMMSALNKALDFNVPDVNEHLHYYYNPYRDDPRFQNWKERVEALAAEQRAVIEADLANPPDPWWTPDMLDETR